MLVQAVVESAQIQGEGRKTAPYSLRKECQRICAHLPYIGGFSFVSLSIIMHFSAEGTSLFGDRVRKHFVIQNWPVEPLSTMIVV